jgi:two-component system, cell cycle sensor histidine kinase PleC
MNSAEQSGGEPNRFKAGPAPAAASSSSSTSPNPARRSSGSSASSAAKSKVPSVGVLAIGGLAALTLVASLALPEWRQVLIGAGVGLLVALLLVYRNQPTPEKVAEKIADRPRKTGWDHSFDNLPGGLAQWDGEGKLVWSNQAMDALLGLTNAQLGEGQIEVRFAGVLENMNRFGQPGSEGAGLSFEVSPADRPALLVEVFELRNGGRICTVRDISKRKEMAARLETVQREHGKLTRCLNEARARAEAASRSKTAFLAHLSHDIRTPLNHIIGFADLIQHQPYGPVGDARYASYIADIKNSGDRLLNSFSQIFELAEMEAGNTPMRCEKIMAADLFARLADRFGERARKTGVELHIALPAKFCLEGDSHCLLRMMGNLVDNALKFTRSGGRVSLAAWAAEDGVVLEVSDTGTGISPGRLALLTEPHLIGEAAFDVENGMPGFGLAIARGIAELSGGSLVIDSTPMVGTTVAVALPRTLSGHSAAGMAIAAA